MTDFLTRLAERALDTLPVARPATAPIFAPGPDLATAEEPDADRAVEGRDAFRRSHDSGEASPQDASRLKQREARPSLPAHSLLPARGEAGKAVSQGATRSISSGEAPDRRVGPRALNAGDASDSSGDVRALRREGRAESERESGNRAEEVSGRRAGGDSRDHDLRAFDLPEGRRPASSRAAIAPVAIRAAEPALPKGVGESSQSGSRAAADERTSPPVIKISIGRVDVRAVEPRPSRAPRADRSRPDAALTLDEYLKQRDEGKR